MAGKAGAGTEELITQNKGRLTSEKVKIFNNRNSCYNINFNYNSSNGF